MDERSCPLPSLCDRTGDVNNADRDSKESLHPYKIQGALNFLQTEWSRLETQRTIWETDRAELEARIKFLEGERYGQENLKQDLVRRIKMLEYALKAERVKYHQLQTSLAADKDTGINAIQPVMGDKDSFLNDSSKAIPSNQTEVSERQLSELGNNLAQSTEQTMETNMKWLESRLRLKRFLQEIGCTDALLGTRRARVLQLLTSSFPSFSKPNSTVTSDCQRNHEVESALAKLEEAVNVVDPISSATESGQHVCRPRHLNKDHASSIENMVTSLVNNLPDSSGGKRYGHGSNTDQLWNFIRTLSEKPEGFQTSTPQNGMSGQSPLGFNSSAGTQETSFAVDNRLNKSGTLSSALGDLENLTVANEIDQSSDGDYGKSGPKSVLLDDQSDVELNTPSTHALHHDHRSWVARFTLRGHFDSIRSVAFHPTDHIVYTASEDGCVIFWNLSAAGKPVMGRNGSGLHTNVDELEPSYVYCGHRGPVLCTAAPTACMAAHTNAAVYTGGLDGTVRGWRLPILEDGGIRAVPDLFAAHDFDSVTGPVFHNPSSSSSPVWSVAMHPTSPVLLACHSDGVLELWSTAESDTRFMSVVNLRELPDTTDAPAIGRPTCSQFFTSSNGSDWSSTSAASTHCLVGTSTGWLLLIDVQTGQIVNRCAPSSSNDLTCSSSTGIPDGWSYQAMNSLASNYTMWLAVGAHEDKCVRFYDICRISGDRSAALIGSMLPSTTVVAHTDSVTSVAMDPNGVCLFTGSHDASVRVWNLETKSCIQEMTYHRVKYNEAVLDVAMHSQLPLAASAGADAVCKIYMSES